MNHYFYQVLYLGQKSPIRKEDCVEPGFADTAAEGNATTLPCQDTTKYLDIYPQIPLCNSFSPEDGAQGVPDHSESRIEHHAAQI